ncbi:MAG: hypothetical protein JO085_01570, partial [Acidimicrobiia bacterium]|nr:hypothetical protein [Acidimicrobiia bacterium]
GRLTDADLFDRQIERWRREIKPGAKGYLGSTSGTTADGIHFAAVRFESEAAAQANSERSEQGAWWNETEKAFAGTPAFTNSSDIEELFGGGSNDAGFVQVMKGKVKDMAAFRRWTKDHEDELHRIRPDLIGGIDVWQPDGSFITVAYYTSEAEARKYEKAMASEPSMGEFGAQIQGEMQFLDLTQPDFD